MTDILDYEELAADLTDLGFIEIITPSQIADYRQTILTSAATLNTDFQSTEIDAQILDAWNAWYNDLINYADDSGYFGDLWAGSMKTAERKAAELLQWRDIYKTYSGKNATGVPIEVTTPPGLELDKIGTVVKWLAIPILGYFVWDYLRK